MIAVMILPMVPIRLHCLGSLRCKYLDTRTRWLAVHVLDEFNDEDFLLMMGIFIEIINSQVVSIMLAIDIFIHCYSLGSRKASVRENPQTCSHHHSSYRNRHYINSKMQETSIHRCS